MTKEQAASVLQRWLQVLFPYADPKDDPNKRRGQDQRQAEAALAALRQSHDVDEAEIERRVREAAQLDAIQAGLRRLTGVVVTRADAERVRRIVLEACT